MMNRATESVKQPETRLQGSERVLMTQASLNPIQQLREKIKVDGGEDIDAIIDEQNPKIKRK